MSANRAFFVSGPRGDWGESKDGLGDAKVFARFRHWLCGLGQSAQKERLNPAFSCAIRVPFAKIFESIGEDAMRIVSTSRVFKCWNCGLPVGGDGKKHKVYVAQGMRHCSFGCARITEKRAKRARR